MHKMNPNDPKNTKPPTTKPLKHIIKYYHNSTIKCREYNLNENNQLHGLYESWYQNGQIFIRSNHQNNLLHGLYEEWYPGGQIFICCNYQNNLRHGLYEIWYEPGSLYHRHYFDNGKIE
jgi:antitoxin component YwqK of YwqJK toxin-antitoxin module